MSTSSRETAPAQRAMDRIRKVFTDLQQEARNAARSMGSKNTSGKDTHKDLWEKYLD